MVGDELIPEEYRDANGKSFELRAVFGVSYKLKGEFFGFVRCFQGLTDSTDNNDFQLVLTYNIK